LNLPGFEAIAQTALAALTAHPDQVLEIAQLALADFQAGQQAVIAGDRIQGGVSTALTELAIPSVAGTAIPLWMTFLATLL
jgi:chemotaxis family two-component system sensor histidine kinase/response regulator PixL